MAFTIVYSPTALDDWKNLIEWSWQKHPDTTPRFLRSMRNYINLLQEAPHMGLRVKRRPEIRRLSHDPFHIYYRIDETEKRIAILHFRDAMRRKPRL